VRPTGRAQSRPNRVPASALDAFVPSADDLGGDQAGDVVAIADLAARTDAVALLRADHVAVRGG
jgi:hypothetical protein